tara:strand:- start:500 stop:679 length:180 start_codon:yes stop_codon:yes gene_type:complete
MNPEFTKEELTKIWDMATDEVSTVMCGDWDAIQEDLSVLHSIQAKVCSLRKNLLEVSNE